MGTATFGQALSDVGSVMGEDAIFTNSTGATSALVVWYYQDLEEQPGVMNTQMPVPEKVIEYTFTDIGRQTRRGEKFTINGTDYVCQRVLDDNGYTVSVAVK